MTMQKPSSCYQDWSLLRLFTLVALFILSGFLSFPSLASVEPSSSGYTSALDSIVFQGRVFKVSISNPIAYSSIVLQNNRGGVYADSNGQFTFKVPSDLIAKNKVLVTLRHPGYREKPFFLSLDSTNILVLLVEDEKPVVLCEIKEVKKGFRPFKRSKKLLKNDTVEFKGIILDSATQEPVAFATVVVKGQKRAGTYSQENGSFVLKLHGIKPLTDSILVRVQYLCYKDVHLVLHSNEEAIVTLVPIVDCEIGFSHGCGPGPTINKGIKSRPFKGFGTKFLKKD
jgi:hypothetical protein